MRNALLELLVDPVERTPLELVDGQAADGEIESGILRGPSGDYAIADGIPRLVAPSDEAQAQTARSFGYKWRRRDTFASDEARAVSTAWLVERYGFADLAALRRHLDRHDRFLDAGCGSAYTGSLIHDGRAGEPVYFGIDISDAIDVARERLGQLDDTHFVQADLMRLPLADGSVDVAFADGVLHHTPSTWDALDSVARAVRPGGEVWFYVYRRKAPAREFTDDHVRGLVSGLDEEVAWELLRPLTRLGRSLAELHAEIDVPEPIEVLGIPAGRHDVQRLVYWHFAKLFWNEALSEEDNLHVNFDWFHPRYAHRATEDEVRDACARSGLEIVHLDAQESGFSVRALKR